MAWWDENLRLARAGWTTEGGPHMTERRGNADCPRSGAWGEIFRSWLAYPDNSTCRQGAVSTQDPTAPTTGHPSFGGRSHRLTDRDKVFLGTEYCQVGVLDAGPCPQSRNYLALPPRTLSQLEAGDPVDLLDRKFGSFSDIHAGRVKDGLHSKIACESHGVLVHLWCIEIK